ncbi:MAG: YeeE/YedE family protein [Rhodobacteraceae bacterium]|nr:YeeE/YedE family protein [Paracoccaceae bacterium]
MDILAAGHIAALIGAFGGAVLGLSARLGGFCTLGAIESAAYGGDQRQLRMWGLALGLAIILCGTLVGVGQIDLMTTLYHRTDWNPAASIVGGLTFGYGMALAGNCGFGALARVAGGDLRALAVTVCIAIAGYMALNGPLAGLRVALFPATPSVAPQSIALTAGDLTGLPPFAVALAIGLALIAWALTHAPFRNSTSHVVWAAAAGLAIVWALWAMSLLHRESFGEVAVEGYTYTAPLGKTLLYFMTAPPTGLGFAVGSVLGVVGGAAAASLWRRQFRWEACDDPRELGRQFGGAFLMGIGGVIAAGCSIGQGLTAFATLAYSGPVTLACIGIGALIGLRQLITSFQPD